MHSFDCVYYFSFLYFVYPYLSFSFFHLFPDVVIKDKVWVRVDTI
jgi:hypothetical protein